VFRVHEGNPDRGWAEELHVQLEFLSDILVDVVEGREKGTLLVLLYVPKLALVSPPAAHNTPRRFNSGSVRRYSGLLRSTARNGLNRQAALCKSVQSNKVEIATLREVAGGQFPATEDSRGRT
jgi:hypothetical protein